MYRFRYNLAVILATFFLSGFEVNSAPAPDPCLLLDRMYPKRLSTTATPPPKEIEETTPTLDEGKEKILLFQKLLEEIWAMQNTTSSTTVKPENRTQDRPRAFYNVEKFLERYFELLNKLMAALSA